MKRGLDFFSFDVDFFDDEKIQYVSARFGIKGEVCAIRLLTRIYRNGYFLKWDEDAPYLFAKVAGNGFTPDLVNGIVDELAKRGFFDKALLNSFGVLTSHGIQQRYFKACERRKKIEVDERLLLVDPSDFKNLQIRRSTSCYHSEEKCRHHADISNQNADISNQNADISKQSKVEESRGKERKVDVVKDPATTPYEAFRIYANNIHPVSSEIEKDRLLDLIDHYGDEWICKAIERAVMRNKRNLGYIIGILRRWETEGYDDDTAYNSRNPQHNQRKAGKQQAISAVQNLMARYEQEAQEYDEEEDDGGN